MLIFFETISYFFRSSLAILTMGRAEIVEGVMHASCHISTRALEQLIIAEGGYVGRGPDPRKIQTIRMRCGVLRDISNLKTTM